jgi:hypothetical protein
MQEGRYPEAEQLYAGLTRLTPQVAEVYSNLGLSRYYQKKFDPAESAFRTALGLKSDMFVPNLLLGEIYAGKGRYPAALPLAERAVKGQPREKAARRLLASVWLGLGRRDQAIEQYKKLLDEDPRDEDSHHIAPALSRTSQKAIDRLTPSRVVAFVTAEFTPPGLASAFATRNTARHRQPLTIPGSESLLRTSCSRAKRRCPNKHLRRNWPSIRSAMRSVSVWLIAWRAGD